jgi:predicted RNase H-like HicB family nuclease
MNVLFPVLVDKSANQWVAYFPDVFGANARGSTIAKALQGAEEALFLVLTNMREEGKAFPKPSAIRPGNAAIVTRIAWD